MNVALIAPSRFRAEPRATIWPTKMPTRERVVAEIEGLLRHAETALLDTQERREGVTKGALSLLRRALPYLRGEQENERVELLETACILIIRSTVPTGNPKVTRVTDHEGFTFGVARLRKLLGVNGHEQPTN